MAEQVHEKAVRRLLILSAKRESIRHELEESEKKVRQLQEVSLKKRSELAMCRIRIGSTSGISSKNLAITKSTTDSNNNQHSDSFDASIISKNSDESLGNNFPREISPKIVNRSNLSPSKDLPLSGHEIQENPSASGTTENLPLSNENKAIQLEQDTSTFEIVRAEPSQCFNFPLNKLVTGALVEASSMKEVEDLIAALKEQLYDKQPASESLFQDKYWWPMTIEGALKLGWTNQGGSIFGLGDVLSYSCLMAIFTAEIAGKFSLGKLPEMPNIEHQTPKQARIEADFDPNVPICPFELDGTCNDFECQFQHFELERQSKFQKKTKLYELPKSFLECGNIVLKNEKNLKNELYLNKATDLADPLTGKLCPNNAPDLNALSNVAGNANEAVSNKSTQLISNLGVSEQLSNWTVSFLTCVNSKSMEKSIFPLHSDQIEHLRAYSDTVIGRKSIDVNLLLALHLSPDTKNDNYSEGFFNWVTNKMKAFSLDEIGPAGVSDNRTVLQLLSKALSYECNWNSEALWCTYLSLVKCSLSKKQRDAMFKHALEKGPISRQIWHICTSHLKAINQKTNACWQRAFQLVRRISSADKGDISDSEVLIGEAMWMILHMAQILVGAGHFDKAVFILLHFLGYENLVHFRVSFTIADKEKIALKQLQSNLGQSRRAVLWHVVTSILFFGSFPSFALFFTSKSTLSSQNFQLFQWNLESILLNFKITVQQRFSNEIFQSYLRRIFGSAREDLKSDDQNSKISNILILNLIANSITFERVIAPKLIDGNSEVLCMELCGIKPIGQLEQLSLQNCQPYILLHVLHCYPDIAEQFWGGTFVLFSALLVEVALGKDPILALCLLLMRSTFEFGSKKEEFDCTFRKVLLDFWGVGVRYDTIEDSCDSESEADILAALQGGLRRWCDSSQDEKSGISLAVLLGSATFLTNSDLTRDLLGQALYASSYSRLSRQKRHLLWQFQLDITCASTELSTGRSTSYYSSREVVLRAIREECQVEEQKSQNLIFESISEFVLKNLAGFHEKDGMSGVMVDAHLSSMFRRFGQHQERSNAKTVDWEVIQETFSEEVLKTAQQARWTALSYALSLNVSHEGARREVCRKLLDSWLSLRPRSYFSNAGPTISIMCLAAALSLAIKDTSKSVQILSRAASNNPRSSQIWSLFGMYVAKFGNSNQAKKIARSIFDIGCTIYFQENMQFSDMFKAVSNMKVTSSYELNLSGALGGIVPSIVFALTGLKTLVLTDNKLTEIPHGLHLLKALSTLDLSYNDITELPADSILWSLISITVLRIDCNRIESLPSELEKLTNLYELSLEGNLLRNVPGSALRIRAIQVLKLAKNLIKTVPVNMLRDLPNLVTLTLEP